MDATQDLIWLIVIIVIIGIIWFFTGGPARESKESPFVIPPTSVRLFDQ